MRGICGRFTRADLHADGHYSTGDLGWLDADGYLFFAGRVDDMFKVSGATVFPTEVEASLRSIDFVSRAYVTNVEGPDGADLVGAVVVTTGDHPLGDLEREARLRMSSFKVPRRWLVATSVDAVPVLPTGKVDQAALRALLVSDGRAVPVEPRRALSTTCQLRFSSTDSTSG